MKRIVFSLLAIITLMPLSCRLETVGDASQCAESFVDLKANFSSPHNTFLPTPLWVWNGTVTKEFIDNSLTDLKEHGFGGVLVHSRYGMTNDYLSEEWFDLFKYSLEKTKKLGMDIWIYDENWCPSGFAGGHVPAGMPESYNQGVSLRENTLTQLDKEDLSDYMAIFASSENGYINITGNAAEYSGKTGNFLAYKKIHFETDAPLHAGFSYVDLLIPGVTEYFLKVTIEDGYKPIVGDEFGKAIVGSFTDEPHISPMTAGDFRWTPDLFERFRERYGYNLEDNLPSIKNNVGDYKQVRHNYYQLLLQLFVDRWAKPNYEYYEANNLEFAGHYWEHCWPSPHFGGDNMAMSSWHQRPTIDLLFNQMDDELPVQFGDVRNVKEISSVANQMGRRRTLSETYGASGWDLTFNDMKRLGDWEYVLGVNTMTQHLIYQSFLGCRKHDFPQSFSYHAPYWDQYATLNDYFGRLSYALSAGQQTNDIVIIEPTTTAWMYYQSNGESERDDNPVLDKINRSFRELLNGLETKQIEYDLASENIIKDRGSIDGYKFVIGKRAYKTVILPEYSESLDEPTVNLLSQFIKNGGEVIIIKQQPSLIDGKNAVYGDEWSKATLLSNNVAAISQLQNTDITFKNINPGDGRFYHMRRELKDGQILFFANSSKTATASASLSIKGKETLLMNPMDGSIKSYPCTQQEGEVSFDISLYPSESMLLFISDRKQKGYELALPKKYSETISPENDDMKIELSGPNVLAIDYLTLSFDGKTLENQYATTVTESLFKARGLKIESPWFNAVHYKQTFADLNKPYEKQPGFKAQYKFVIEGDFDYSGIKGVLEQSYPAAISINGIEVLPIPGEYYIDRDFKVFNIGQHLKKGENIFTIDAPRMSIMAEIEPAFIIGDFTVQPATKGFTINPPAELNIGCWKNQGYPFYSEAVLYSATYNISDTKDYYAIELYEWSGTVAEVSVNGKVAGIIGWAPYTLDVSEYIKEGTNNITVKVIGSLHNVIGPFHVAPKGIATPWSWRYQPPHRSGSEYFQLEYGLFTPFALRRQVA